MFFGSTGFGFSGFIGRFLPAEQPLEQDNVRHSLPSAWRFLGRLPILKPKSERPPSLSSICRRSRHHGLAHARADGGKADREAGADGGESRDPHGAALKGLGFRVQGLVPLYLGFRVGGASSGTSRSTCGNPTRLSMPMIQITPSACFERFPGSVGC